MNYFLKHSFITKRECELALSFCVVILFKFCLNNEQKSDIQSAIDETAKYPVKDTDFMTDDEDKNLKRLPDLEEGLHRKRLISYGGLLKEIHKKLNLDDAEDGDLIHTDDDEKADEDSYSIIAMWNWERKNYFIKD